MSNVKPVVGWLVAALCAALAFGLCPTASADPTAGPDPGSRGRHRDHTFSRTVTQFLNLTNVTDSKALNRSKDRLDYRELAKVFRANSKHGKEWRRNVAAGFVDGGGRLTNISKSERAAVYKLRRHQVRLPRGGADQKRCTGRSGDLRVGNVYYQYFDSCTTAELMGRVDLLTYACGAWLALPQVGVPAGFFCGGWWMLYKSWWADAQRRSTSDSVFTTMTYKKRSDGTMHADWWIYPQ